MTTTFNTGNPVGSTAAKDLSDNASNFDDAVNLQSDTWTDRFAVERDTVNGRIKKMGFAVPVNYAASIVFNVGDNVKTVEYDGVIYAPLPSALPFTTSGTFNGDDDTRFFVVQGDTDNALILNLSQSYIFNTVADFKASDIEFPDGKSIHLNDRGTDFIKITGTGTGNDENIIASNVVNQSVVEIIGSKTNPYTFESLTDFVNNLPYDYIESGNYIQVKGSTRAGDGGYTLYQVVSDITQTVTLNYETYIPVDVNDVTATLWAKAIEGYVLVDRKGSLEIIAHRGFVNSAPENTTLAMTSSYAHGADSLEMDCQVSSDGTVWVNHDPNLAGETNLSGAISASTDAYIESGVLTSTVGTRFDGMGLSKLEDILKFTSTRNIMIYPEMKFSGWTNSAIDIFLALLDSYGYLNEKCVIQAVDTALLEYVRSQNKDVYVSAVHDNTFAEAQPKIDLLHSMGKGVLTWDHDSLLAEKELFFPYCFARGVRIIAYTISDLKKANELFSLGCTGIITDISLRGNI